MGLPNIRSSRRQTAAYIAAIAVIVVFSIRLPNSQWLVWVEDQIVAMGPWGAPAFALIYALALAVYLPALPFTLACGALFGPVVGSITAWIGSTVGAGLGFLVVRYLARDAVARRIRSLPKFVAFDEAVARSGWRVVALFRLTPLMPFVTMNAIAGISSVRFWPFVLATAFAKLPGTIAVVYSGHVGRRNLDSVSLRSLREDPWPWASLALSVVGTTACAIYISRLARRALATQVGPIEDRVVPISGSSSDSTV